MSDIIVPDNLEKIEVIGSALGHRIEERGGRYYAIYNYKAYSGEMEVPGNMIESYERTITYPDNPTPVADVDRTGDEGFVPNDAEEGEN